MNPKIHHVAGIAALAASAGFAGAQVSFYTGLAAWQTDAGGPVVLEDFNSGTIGAFTNGSVSFGPLTLSHNAEGTTSIAGLDDGANFGNIDGTTFVEATTGATPGGVLTLTFDTAVNAVGIDFFSPFSGAGINLVVNGESFALDQSTGISDIVFAGVISTTAFTQIQLVGNYDNGVFQELYSFDNVRSVVPTPGTMVAMGLGGLVATRRRR